MTKKVRVELHPTNTVQANSHPQKFWEAHQKEGFGVQDTDLSLSEETRQCLVLQSFLHMGLLMSSVPDCALNIWYPSMCCLIPTFCPCFGHCLFQMGIDVLAVVLLQHWDLLASPTTFKVVGLFFGWGWWFFLIVEWLTLKVTLEIIYSDFHTMGSDTS